MLHRLCCPFPRRPLAGHPLPRDPGASRLDAVAAALILSFALLIPVTPCRAASSIELCRIRIENRSGGEISASADGGHTYSVLGHVLAPATALVPGFSATAWAKDGTVCATAVHGIRVCVAHKNGRGLLFSLIPREYRRLPDSFGGQRSGSAGIYTDVSAATSIFRNLAPLVGNPVFVEREGILHNIRPGYIPEESDVLVIVVEQPSRMPDEIDFDNRVGGAVEEVFSNGEKVEVARVIHPVYGIGRYDATSYTGVGRINTNHPGVITVSTTEESGVDISDEERGWERRGGFQIVPNVHAEDFHAPPPAMMIVAPPPGSNRPLEGSPPLFSGLIGLNSVPGEETSSYRVQVQIDYGPWEAMPDLTGIDPLLFTARPLSDYFSSRGVRRKVKEGITAFRIVFPHTDVTYASRQIRVAVLQAARGDIDVSASDDHDAVVRGSVQVNVNLGAADSRLKFIVFMVDGAARGYTDVNARPYGFVWDTRSDPNGRHVLTIKGEDSDGAVISERSSKVIVSNGEPGTNQ